MGNDPIQGGGRGTYVALETSSTMGRWDRPPRGAGRRSRRSTRRTGKPSTGGRAAGVRKPGRGGPRDAFYRNRTGNHPRPRQVRCPSPAIAEDTGEPGARKRGTPGSGRGGRKSAGNGNSPAAYSTSSSAVDPATGKRLWRRCGT